MDRLDHDPDADSLPDNIRFASNSIDNDTREDPEPAPAKATGRRKKRKGHHGGMQVHAHNCQPACMQPMMAAQVPVVSVGYAMPLSCCVGVGCHCQPTTEEEDAEEDDDVCEGRKGAVAGTEVWCKCNKKEQPITDASICVNPGGGRDGLCTWNDEGAECVPKPACEGRKGAVAGTEVWCKCNKEEQPISDASACVSPGGGRDGMCKWNNADAVCVPEPAAPAKPAASGASGASGAGGAPPEAPQADDSGGGSEATPPPTTTVAPTTTNATTTVAPTTTTVAPMTTTAAPGTWPPRKGNSPDGKDRPFCPKALDRRFGGDKAKLCAKKGMRRACPEMCDMTLEKAIAEEANPDKSAGSESDSGSDEEEASDSGGGSDAAPPTTTNTTTAAPATTAAGPAAPPGCDPKPMFARLCPRLQHEVDVGGKPFCCPPTVATTTAAPAPTAPGADCVGRNQSPKGTDIWCKCNAAQAQIADAAACENPGGGRGDVCAWDAGTNVCVPQQQAATPMKKPKPACPPTRETPNGSEKVCCKVAGVKPKLMCKCRESQTAVGLDKCKGQKTGYGWKGDARADWGDGKGTEV